MTPFDRIRLEERLREGLCSVLLSRHRFLLRARDQHVVRRFPGSALRGTLGHALKEAVCVVRHRDCPRCILRCVCAYSYMFETPVPANAPRMRKYPAAPHPFAIAVDYREGARLAAGDLFGFTVTLFGQGTVYLPYFVHTFMAIGESERRLGGVRFALQEVRTLGADGTIAGRWSPGDGRPVENAPISAADLIQAPAENAEVALRLESPLRIKTDNELARRVEFPLVVGSLLRRITNIIAFHSQASIDLDFRALMERSREVRIARYDVRFVDWVRYSSRQDAEMNLGGWEGEVRYAPPAGEFLPLLSLAPWFQIGKGTAFGLGRVTVGFEGAEQPLVAETASERTTL